MRKRRCRRLGSTRLIVDRIKLFKHPLSRRLTSGLCHNKPRIVYIPVALEPSFWPSRYKITNRKANGPNRSLKVRHSSIITPVPFLAPPQRFVLGAAHLTRLRVHVALKLWPRASPDIRMKFVSLPCSIDSRSG